MDEAVAVSNADAQEALEVQIADTWAQVSAATYRFLTLVAGFDRSEGWARYGLASCAQWLNWRCGISGVAAREKLRVATPANEHVLLDAAMRGTAVQVERLVRDFRSVAPVDAALEADARYRDRICNIGTRTTAPSCCMRGCRPRSVRLS